MSKKLISAEVVMQMLNLPLEKVKAAIESGGGHVAGGKWDTLDAGTNKERYEITGAKCVGMLSSGAFVYEVEGQTTYGNALPAWIKRFKIGVEYNPKFLDGMKPEYVENYRNEVVGDCRIYWK